jgi:hypothetical protein
MMVRVTGLAIEGCHRVSHRLNFVQDFKMTLGALYLVVGDMVLVHELGIVIPGKAVWLGMAPHATLTGHRPVSLNDINMTSTTIDALRYHLLVIDFYALNFDDFSRRGMA